MNNAMITAVVTFVEDPWRYALVRSSGTRGSDVYEELVSLGQVQLWITTPDTTTIPDVVHIPIHYTKSSLWESGCTIPLSSANDGSEGDAYQDVTTTTTTTTSTSPVYNDVICISDNLWVVPNPAPFAINEDGGGGYVTLGMSLRSGTHKHNNGTRQHHNHPIRDNENLPFLRHLVVTHCESLEELRCVPHSGIYELTVELIGESVDCEAEVWSREDGVETPTNLLASIIGLRNVNMPVLQCTAVIQKGFLSDNATLKSVDLTCIRNAEEIHESFLEGCVALSQVDLGPLSVVGGGCPVVSIGPKFLAGSGIRTLDLSPLCTIAEIPSHFLDGCQSLEHIDISPLSSSSSTPLTEIDDYFMRGCSNLRSIQLGKKLCNNINNASDEDDDVRADTTCTAPNILEKVVCIQNNFLAQCPKPRSIDLSPLGNVSSIGGYFMKDCKGLESLDLAPLLKVLEVGPEFLRNCMKLVELDVGPLCNVSIISASFLKGCYGLRIIHNFHTFHLLSEIRDHFVSECSSLSSIKFPAHPLKAVGGYCMAGCTHLSTIPTDAGLALSELQNGIPPNFMSACGGISEINLNDMLTSSSLPTQVNEGFLLGWVSLTQLNLRPLSNVTRIGSAFLFGCHHLSRIDLAPLEHIDDIPPLFLSECKGLVEVDLEPLRNCTTIQEGFLNGCSSLTSITLTPLRKIQHIPSHFLTQCHLLEFVDFGGLEMVQTISDNFMSGCESLVEVDLTPLKKCISISLYSLFESGPPYQVVKVLNTQIATTLQTSKRCRDGVMKVVVSTH